MKIDTLLAADYAEWLVTLKARIQAAQQRATLAVNRELVLMYWQVWAVTFWPSNLPRAGGQGD